MKLLDCFRVEEMQPSSGDDLQVADSIVAFSMGFIKEEGVIKPGKSNEFLAGVVEKYQKQFKLPVISQWEIAECLQEAAHLIIRKHRKEDKYLDTHEVAYQAKRVLNVEKLSRPIIVAEPFHMWRCFMTVKKLGFFPRVADTSGCPFDEKSEQKWTRSEELFQASEKKRRAAYCAFRHI